MRQTHTHSGALGRGLLVVPLIGIASVVLLAALFGAATVCETRFLPRFKIVPGFLLIGFVVALIAILRMSVRWGKVRNRGFMILSGSLLGLLAVYVSWASFLGTFDYVRGGSGSFLGYLQSPGAMWEAAGRIAEKGWYTTLRGTRPSGFILWLFWVLEALILTGGGVLAGLSSTLETVFCEVCSDWAADVEPPACFAFPSDGTDLEFALGEEIKSLEGLEPLPAGGTLKTYLQAELKRCGCGATAALQLRRRGGSGDEANNQALMERVLISPEEAARVVSLAAPK